MSLSIRAPAAHWRGAGRAAIIFSCRLLLRARATPTVAPGCGTTGWWAARRTRRQRPHSKNVVCCALYFEAPFPPSLSATWTMKTTTDEEKTETIHTPPPRASQQPISLRQLLCVCASATGCCGHGRQRTSGGGDPHARSWGVRGSPHMYLHTRPCALRLGAAAPLCTLPLGVRGAITRRTAAMAMQLLLLTHSRCTCYFPVLATWRTRCCAGYACFCCFALPLPTARRRRRLREDNKERALGQQ